jgi:hypothetical protein
MVGTARKKENSAAVLRPTPIDNAPRFDEPLDEKNGHAPHDQRDRHHQWCFQHQVDRVLGEHADHGRRQKAERDVAHKMQRFALAAKKPGRHAPEQLAVSDHHRHDRAQLDDDIELRPLRRIVAEELGCEDQVPGGRNGQELGQPFQDAEQNGGERGVHILGANQAVSLKSTELQVT